MATITRRDGSVRPLQSLDFGMLPEIDSVGMSARFRICTPRMDREGDIIEPSGVTWEDYRFAPVVKFEHGFSGIPMPIAKSADDSGILHMSYGDPSSAGEFEDAIYARAFFSDRHELSAQMFALIEDGFLRAASIHTLPVQGCVKSLPNNRFHALQSTVLEWSVATVAMNPDSYAKALVGDSALAEVLNLQLDAANKILERGTLASGSILPSLAKCLSSVLPAKKPIVLGHDPKEETMSKKMTSAEIAKLTPIALAKAMCDPTAYDAETLKQIRAMAKSYDDPSEDAMAKADVPAPEDDPAATAADTSTAETESPDVADTTTSDVSPGADFLSAIHSAINDLVSKLDAANKATEKPEVLEFAKQFADSLRTELASCEGAYSSIYPDAPGLSPAEEPADAEMVKSWVSQNSKSAYQLEGLASRLAKCLKDPKKLALVANQTARDLRLLNSQAKSWKPKTQPEGVVTVEQFNQLTQRVESLVDVLLKSPAPFPA